MALPMSPSYDRYGRQPIGMGERQRRRRRVSSTAPERGDSNANARRLANMTVNAREFTKSEPPPRHELPMIEEIPAQVAKVEQGGRK